MKIAIVSDTHNNWLNFKKAIDWIKKEKISVILHCGDINSQEMVDESRKHFSEGVIHFVRGNGDYGLDVPEKMELELDNRKVSFCHFPDSAKKMAQSGKYDVVFYGHTHRPWDEKVACPAMGECHMINPGELAGHFYKPSFAVYDTTTGMLELKILENL